MEMENCNNKWEEVLSVNVRGQLARRKNVEMKSTLYGVQYFSGRGNSQKDEKNSFYRRADERKDDSNKVAIGAIGANFEKRILSGIKDIILAWVTMSARSGKKHNSFRIQKDSCVLNVVNKG